MMRAMSRSRAFSTAGSEKIAMVGSGNFGSALVRILGRNALKHDVFDNEVKMYVHEEMIDGKPLTSIINETNENVKYLKGAKFTPNVVADPDIASAVSGATMVCFCLPHQFLKPMVPAIVAAAAPGVKCLSAIKGIDFDDSVRPSATPPAARDWCHACDRMRFKKHVDLWMRLCGAGRSVAGHCADFGHHPQGVQRRLLGAHGRQRGQRHGCAPRPRPSRDPACRRRLSRHLSPTGSSVASPFVT